MWQNIVYSLRIRRVEYRLAELPIFLIPVLLTVARREELYGIVMWEGLIAFLFLFAFGDLLNCLADRDLDSVYKPHLTQAVYGLGVRGVILQAVFSAIAAIVLTTHVSMRTNRWILVPMILIGLTIAWAYSVEPVRLKRRGVWQLLFYWLGLFVAPMIFAASLFADTISTQVAVIAVAFASVQTGVILVNTAEDYREDKAMNIRTAIVACGLKQGIRLAFWFSFCGSIMLVGSFLWQEFENFSHQGLSTMSLVPLSIATTYCIWSIGRLDRSVQRASSEDEAVVIVKHAAKRVPLWMSSIAITTVSPPQPILPLCLLHRPIKYSNGTKF